MDEKTMIDDLVKMLDVGMANGVGHFNIDCDEDETSKNVQTMGCTDCSKNPMACSIPTPELEPDDDSQ